MPTSSKQMHLLPPACLGLVPPPFLSVPGHLKDVHRSCAASACPLLPQARAAPPLKEGTEEKELCFGADPMVPDAPWRLRSSGGCQPGSETLGYPEGLRAELGEEVHTCLGWWWWGRCVCVCPRAHG